MSSKVDSILSIPTNVSKAHQENDTRKSICCSYILNEIFYHIPADPASFFDVVDVGVANNFWAAPGSYKDGGNVYITTASYGYGSDIVNPCRKVDNPNYDYLPTSFGIHFGGQKKFLYIGKDE